MRGARRSASPLCRRGRSLVLSHPGYCGIFSGGGSSRPYSHSKTRGSHGSFLLLR